MDIGAGQATVHRVTKSQTQLSMRAYNETKRLTKTKIVTIWPFIEDIYQDLLQSANINYSQVFQLLKYFTHIPTFFEISNCSILQMRKPRTGKIKAYPRSHC